MFSNFLNLHAYLLYCGQIPIFLKLLSCALVPCSLTIVKRKKQISLWYYLCFISSHKLVFLISSSSYGFPSPPPLYLLYGQIPIFLKLLSCSLVPCSLTVVKRKKKNFLVVLFVFHFITQTCFLNFQ